MAYLETSVKADLDDLAVRIERSLSDQSVSSCKEFEKDLTVGDSRVKLQTYERFSYMGGNRVSMHITYIQRGEYVEIIGVTAGGSSARFFKINTIGEEEFLRTLEEAINDSRRI